MAIVWTLCMVMNFGLYSKANQDHEEVFVFLLLVGAGASFIKALEAVL